MSNKNSSFHKVTVIVPVYEAEDYLASCIQSILMQEWDNLQLILIDDGSMDNSGSICDMYASQDSRIEVIHKENEGISKARNAGMDHAVGDYISFVDADDCWADHFVLRDLMQFANDSEVDLISAVALHIDNNKMMNVQRKMQMTAEKNAIGGPNTYFDHKIISGSEVLLAHARAGLMVTPHIFSRRILEGHRFNSETRIGEDILFMSEVFPRVDRAVLCRRVTYLRRLNPQSITHRSYMVGILEEQSRLYQQVYKNLQGMEGRDILFEKIYTDQTSNIRSIVTNHKQHAEEKRILRERVSKYFPHWLRNPLIGGLTKLYLLLYLISPGLFCRFYTLFKKSKKKINREQKPCIEKNDVINNNINNNRPTTVTLGIVAHNEEEHLPDLLEDLRKQTYPHERIEVILVDSVSEDRTKPIMRSFLNECEGDFKRILILDNPERIQAAGWNKVIREMSCDVIIRVDAHSTIQEDFVKKNIDRIESGEDVCGGPVNYLTTDHTVYGRMLLDAETSSFGSSPAEYRHDLDEIKYVKSISFAAYRREVFDVVGLFNEDLVRTEDNELHWRITKAGYRICFDPLIRSGHYIRNNLRGMLIQKYLNGYWIGRTIYVCPGCISAFHLVPLFFVLSLLIGVAMATLGVPLLIKTILITYTTAMIGNAIWCFIRTRNIADLFLPVICLIIHISYGTGTAIGIITGTKNKYSARNQ